MHPVNNWFCSFPICHLANSSHLFRKPTDNLFSVSFITFESGRYEEEQVWTGRSSTPEGVWQGLRCRDLEAARVHASFSWVFSICSQSDSHTAECLTCVNSPHILLLSFFFLQLDHKLLQCRDLRIPLFLPPSIILASTLEATRVLINLAKGTLQTHGLERWCFTRPCVLWRAPLVAEPVRSLTWEQVQAMGKPSSGSWKVCVSILLGTTTTTLVRIRVQQMLTNTTVCLGLF